MTEPTAAPAPQVRYRSLAHECLSVLCDVPRTAEQVADLLAAPTRGKLTSTQEAREALESLAERGLALKERPAGEPANRYRLNACGEGVLRALPHPRLPRP